MKFSSMKKYFLFILALMSIHIAQAQTSEKAMKLYEQSKNKINSLKDYSFTFTFQSDENFFDGLIKVKGQKFNIKLDGLSMIYEGKKTYSINLQDIEVKIFNKSEDMGILTTTNILYNFTTSE